MTIGTLNSFVIAEGNGISAAFQFPFVYDQASDVTVYYTDTLGNTSELLDTQYTLVLNPPPTNGLWGIGGTVNYPLSGSPIPSGSFLTILRTVPDTQAVTISNQGIFYPQVVERALDILCMEIQQISDTVNSRAFLIPIGSTLTPLQYLEELIAALIPAAGSSPSTGNISTITTSYTVQSRDVTILADATSGPIPITLPNVVTNMGRFLNFKKVDSSGNAVTFIGTIDGSSVYSLNFQNQSITLQSNGASWSVF